MVGIFWLLPDLSHLFYAHKVRINFAQKYGDWLISWVDHNNVWDELEQSGYLQYLPKRYRTEYWKLPRGRVSYNIVLNKYFIYHGNYFMSQHAKIIEAEFELTAENIVYEEDRHYYIKRNC